MSVVFILGRQRALELSLGLFQIANGELRTEVETGRVDRQAMRVDMEQKLADERAECSRSLGELQGQITALTSGLGRDIANAVLSAFQQGQASNGGVVSS